MQQRRSDSTGLRFRCIAITSALIAAGVTACGQGSDSQNGSGGSANGASGGSAGASDSNENGGANGGAGGSVNASTGGTDTSGVGLNGYGGSAFNQCGVKAPLPAETGQCTKVTAPLITNFDDFTGTDATQYGFSVNTGTDGAIAGTLLHVGDGSDENGGTSVIATEMVPGEGGSGYALRFSSTNAANWGGLLMLLFPGSATVLGCLDARTYKGLEFSLKGASPSGRFGVSMSLLDTTTVAENGLCDNAVASDCKDPRIEMPLPKDPETWIKVQVPWSALTPGVGSGFSCIPLTGQNIVRIVIQPYMSYPPPDFKYKAGPYSLTVDNISFY
ncbi:MAG: hypothetical protein QM784_32840 [Polyangiaceae bacterium]